MFAGVAPRYDFLNHALSGGIDVLWRRRTVREALSPDEGRPLLVLDVCTGTADLALAFAARGCEVVGADFCQEMLAIGEQKRRRKGAGVRLRLLNADALRLPFADDQFDVASVAFGIRNLEDPVRGLREMARVVRPGGRVLVLEFALPRAPLFGRLYGWYFRHVLPRVGSLLAERSRDSGAYRYLPDSVVRFPERGDFIRLMHRAGLAQARYDLLSWGIAALYVGQVPDRG